MTNEIRIVRRNGANMSREWLGFAERIFFIATLNGATLSAPTTIPTKTAKTIAHFLFTKAGFPENLP
jgi:hypothetical protein